MSLAEIKKRLSYIENNNLFDEIYISDMKDLLSKLELAQKCLKEVFDSEGLRYVKAVLDQLKEWK